MEIGENDGPDVSRYLGSVGLPAGYAWCAAFMAWCLDAGGNTDLPAVRSARARDYITRRSVEARDVALGRVTPTFGWLVIFKRGNRGLGHIGLVIWWSGRCGITIEGNTSSGVYGSQADGDGVWIRQRCYEAGAHFSITHFTPYREKSA